MSLSNKKFFHMIVHQAYLDGAINRNELSMELRKMRIRHKHCNKNFYE